jgi:type IV secretion system protein VirB9
MGKSITLAILLALSTAPVLAEKSPEPSPADARIRSVSYNPRDVVALQGAYGYAMSVRFADHERVHDVALGDSVAWQAQVTGDKRGILLKPVETNANTNLLVRTSERLYHFSLAGFEASGPNDPRLTYAVHFHYPQDELRQQAAAADERERIKSTEVAPALGPESYNWRYSWAGADRSKPLRVFDDGRFTYFQFEEGRPLPAIFAVDEEGNEALVNSHQRGNFTVVERRERQFSLRDGNAVTCIFDDTAPAPKQRSANYRRRKPL